jgi:nucleoside-diphosphate-sugar epimerase
MAAMRIAVTGGRGRMGLALCAIAVKQGHEVVSIDNRPVEVDAAHDPGLRQVTVDVTSYDEVVGALDGSDGVIHLAAFPSPGGRAAHEVHNMNVVANYNALCAAVDLGISHVCLASSVNATGATFSRQPRYDYFPLDESHPTYNEDPYSLSKWAGEAQADSIARRHGRMTISSLRLHHLVGDRASAEGQIKADDEYARRELWGYTTLEAASRAALATLSATWTGHEVFYIVAPRTALNERSVELCQRFYPHVPIIGDMGGNAGFFRTEKAARLLGWAHDDPRA